MAIRTVTVRIRIKTPKGKRVYANPVCWDRGRTMREFNLRRSASITELQQFYVCATGA